MKVGTLKCMNNTTVVSNSARISSTKQNMVTKPINDQLHFKYIHQISLVRACLVLVEIALSSLNNETASHLSCTWINISSFFVKGEQSVLQKDSLVKTTESNNLLLRMKSDYNVSATLADKYKYNLDLLIKNRWHNSNLRLSACFRGVMLRIHFLKFHNCSMKLRARRRLRS